MKKIVIQGLGYVGLAMMTFCAGAKKNSKYIYNVVGIEKNSAKGLKIVNRELDEQILNDGGNFERSPMYHSFFLEDLLDLINISHVFSGNISEPNCNKWKKLHKRNRHSGYLCRFILVFLKILFPKKYGLWIFI